MSPSHCSFLLFIFSILGCLVTIRPIYGSSEERETERDIVQYVRSTVFFLLYFGLLLDIFSCRFLALYRWHISPFGAYIRSTVVALNMSFI